ncbi:MAG TPA: hypothetical protein VEN81_02825 [Planctomycetota bacterium]|nr:hypothetical protein [Planctomycetota bacterium]
MTDYEKKGWFRLSLPEGWEADESEDPVSFYHPEGPGALQATVQAPRPLKPGEKVDVYLMLRAFLKQSGVDIESIDSERRSERGIDWASCEYASESDEEGEIHWRVWLATNHDVIAFFTYACPVEEQDRERPQVDALLKTLELR